MMFAICYTIYYVHRSFFPRDFELLKLKEVEETNLGRQPGGDPWGVQNGQEEKTQHKDKNERYQGA